MRVSPEDLLKHGLLALAAVCLSCDRPPVLPDMGLSTIQVQFLAPAAGGDPASQSIYVVNTGEGALDAPTADIAYQDNPGWLTAVVRGSQAPYEVQLTAVVGNRAPGRYPATLTLACANASSSPLQVAVTLEVPQPRFTLSKPELVFSVPVGQGNPAPQRVAVTNGGRGTLPVPQATVSVVGNGAWLTAKVEAAPSGFDVVTSVDASTLGAGTYLGTVTLTAVAGTAAPVTLGVKLVVGLPETVSIAAPPDGSDPAAIVLAVANIEGSTDGLSATVTFDDWKGAPWLSATVEAGTLAPFALVLRARSLRTEFFVPSGTHWATVSVASKGTVGSLTTSIRVRLTVPVSGMSLSSDRVTMEYSGGCDGDQHGIGVAAVGAGSLPLLTATVSSEAASWLKATVTQPSSAPSRSAELSLAFLRPPPQGATAQVTLSAPEASAQLLTLRVDGITRVQPLARLSTFGPTDYHLQIREGVVTGRRLFSSGTVCRPTTPTITFTFPPGTPAWLSAKADTSSDGGSTFFSWSMTADGTGIVPGTTVRATMRVPELEAYGAYPIEWTLTMGTLQTSQPMSAPRSGHSLTPLTSSRRLLAAGGDGALRSAELFSADNRTWVPTGSMSIGRSGHAAVSVHGGVLVCGGRGDAGAQYTCEFWSADTGTWKTVTTLLHARTRPSMSYLSTATSPGSLSRVLVTDEDSPAELIDPDTWSSREASIPGGGMGTAFAPFPSSGYWGFTVGSGRASTWQWEGLGFRWDGPLDVPLRSPRPVLARIHEIGVLLLGGQPHDRSAGEAVIANGAIWNARTQPSSATSHTMEGTVPLTSGQVATVAGYPGEESADIEMYNPDTETWSVPASFPSARAGTRAAVLDDGTVVFSGGTLVDGSATAETFVW